MAAGEQLSATSSMSLCRQRFFLFVCFSALYPLLLHLKVVAPAWLPLLIGEVAAMARLRKDGGFLTRWSSRDTDLLCSPPHFYFPVAFLIIFYSVLKAKCHKRRQENNT